jgi:hypothetical protein
MNTAGVKLMKGQKKRKGLHRKEQKYSVRRGAQLGPSSVIQKRY